MHKDILPSTVYVYVHVCVWCDMYMHTCLCMWILKGEVECLSKSLSNYLLRQDISLNLLFFPPTKPLPGTTKNIFNCLLFTYFLLIIVNEVDISTYAKHRIIGRKNFTSTKDAEICI